MLECTAMNASGLKAGGAGYAPPDYAVPIRGIEKPVVFDTENAKIDEQLLKGKRPVKKKIVKIVHGVPIHFRDERAAMSASEVRKLMTRQKSMRMTMRLNSKEGLRMAGLARGKSQQGLEGTEPPEGEDDMFGGF